MSSPEISRIVEKDQRFTDFAGTRNTRHAPSVTAAEMKMSPAVERPVRSLSQPTMAGKKKPARLAKQYPAAMPAAADMPPSSAVGSDQNCDDDARMPAAATLKQTIDAGTLPSVGRIAKPAAAISIGMARCSRRSRRRSALMPTSGNATIAHRYGIAVNTPTHSGSATPDLRMMVGSQKVRPYWPSTTQK